MTSTEQLSELRTYCTKYRIDFERLMEEAWASLNFHVDPGEAETRGWVEWIMNG